MEWCGVTARWTMVHMHGKDSRFIRTRGRCGLKFDVVRSDNVMLDVSLCLISQSAASIYHLRRRTGTLYYKLRVS